MATATATGWPEWSVTMTTAQGGRFIDTVKARTRHEAMVRANRLNGHYTGGRWYADSAERKEAA